jgi:hypothetical protein
MKRHIRRDVVRGAPFTANGRVLVPEARILSVRAAEAAFGTQVERFAGFQWARIMPTALIEPASEGARRYEIVDVTGRALLKLAVAAICVAIAAQVFAGWIGRQSSRR